MYVGGTGHASDRQCLAMQCRIANGNPATSKCVVFKEEAKRRKQKQYNSKIEITVRCEWEGFAVAGVTETSFLVLGCL
jgi:hypothetical protein